MTLTCFKCTYHENVAFLLFIFLSLFTGRSTRQCLLAMVEEWKRSVDSGKVFDALLTDFSKAFDCLYHELLIAKLNAYGFILLALRLIHDYLSHRKQRTRVMIHIVNALL